MKKAILAVILLVFWGCGDKQVFFDAEDYKLQRAKLSSLIAELSEQGIIDIWGDYTYKSNFKNENKQLSKLVHRLNAKQSRIIKYLDIEEVKMPDGKKIFVQIGVTPTACYKKQPVKRFNMMREYTVDEWVRIKDKP
ncbi:MAG: hypothetical protein GY853_13520 [PVC group bacterium]|nr:hypothetical protein [PVC group bacterium]